MLKWIDVVNHCNVPCPNTKMRNVHEGYLPSMNNVQEALSRDPSTKITGALVNLLRSPHKHISHAMTIPVPLTFPPTSPQQHP
jgi:hypothetical protein